MVRCRGFQRGRASLNLIFGFGYPWLVQMELSLSCRECAEGVVECISVENVSLGFLACVIEFQKVRVSVGVAGGFPPRAGSVGVRVSSCVCRLGMFLPIVFSVF